MEEKAHYGKRKRVGIYARVSTIDKDQDPETQLMPLRAYCQARGFEVVGEFVDHSSGKTTKNRPEFARLRELARKRKLDVVLVFRYDRFARSVQELVNALEEFKGIGIDFVSYMENVDTTTPHGKLFFTLIAGFSEFLSSLIGENVKAGMTRAKAQGKRVSRPRIPLEKQAEILRLFDEGKSMNSIAKQLGIAYGTVYNYLSESPMPPK